jgi:2-methylfumaryl-CoA isomerase
MVCAITTRQWSNLIQALDLSAAVSALESALDVSFATDEGLRFVHRNRLYPLFDAAFASRDSGDLGSLLDAAGVTWGPYQSLREAVMDDARLISGNPMFAPAAQPSGIDYPNAGPAAMLPAEARGECLPAPRLGQHTDEVLATVLGLPDHEIARLHDAGTVAGAPPR